MIKSLIYQRSPTCRTTDANFHHTITHQSQLPRGPSTPDKTRGSIASSNFKTPLKSRHQCIRRSSILFQKKRILALEKRLFQSLHPSRCPKHFTNRAVDRQIKWIWERVSRRRLEHHGLGKPERWYYFAKGHEFIFSRDILERVMK